MALGSNYATRDQFKDYLKIPPGKTTYDDLLDDCLDTSSREIESCTHRQFNRPDDDDEPTQRIYYPLKGSARNLGYLLTGGGAAYVHVDDFYSTDGLIVEVFGQIWTPDEYELHPLNGIVDGQPGWPWYQIRATLGPRYRGIPWGAAPVKVTARWGWSSVPSPVHQACLLKAAHTFQLKDAPLGVAGVDSFGAPMRVRDTDSASRKLKPYVKQPVLVG